MKSQPLSDEQKMALKLTKLMNSDVTMNLDLVGKYLHQIRPSTGLNRLHIVTEAALEEKEKYDNFIWN